MYQNLFYITLTYNTYATVQSAISGRIEAFYQR